MNPVGDKPSPAIVEDKQHKNAIAILASLGPVMTQSNLLHRSPTGIMDSELDITADH